MNESLDSPYINSITVDNLNASRLAAEHLLGLGHRKLTIVTGLMNTITGKQRFQGFVDTLSAHDVPLLDDNVLIGNFKLECGVEIAQRIMGLAEPPTAVFFSSDLMLYGAVGELTANGWRVPEDISVIGCEDLPMSVCFSPRITTVHVPIYSLGRQAAKSLIKRMEKPRKKRSNETLNVELIIRQSTHSIR